jgi:hypothetical protein
MDQALVSDDGVKFTELVPKLLAEGYPTEAVIRIAADGTAYCLQRRDGSAPANSAYLGVSQPPYRQWQWHDLHEFFGGPNLLQIPDGQWIAAGRIVRDGETNNRCGVARRRGQDAHAAPFASQRRRHQLPGTCLSRRRLVGQLLLKPRGKDQYLSRQSAPHAAVGVGSKVENSTKEAPLTLSGAFSFSQKISKVVVPRGTHF